MSLTIVNDAKGYCTHVREVNYELEWTPERNYEAGTEIHLRSHRLRAFVSWKYIRSNMDGADVIWRWPSQGSISEIFKNAERRLFRARLQYGARMGVPMKIHLTLVPPTYAGVDEKLSIWTVDIRNNFAPDAPEPDAYKEEGSECILPALPSPVDRLQVYAKPTPDADGNVDIAIVPLDCCGNPTVFKNTIKATLCWRNSTAGDTATSPCSSQEAPKNAAPAEGDVTLDNRHQAITIQGITHTTLPAPQGMGRIELRLALEQLALNENISNACSHHGEAIRLSNPVWTELPKGLRPAFGEFHWHTDFSGDGQRPIKEAFRCAREDLHLDFAAPSDHNPADFWTETVAAVDDAEDPGKFAAFYGWEAGGNKGHENLYFTDPQHPLICNGTAEYWGGNPADTRDKLAEYKDVLIIPHHTNAVAETRKIEDDTPYWHPYAWTTPTPNHRLVEIIQTRGNQERNEYTDEWMGWHQHHGASVQDALRLGYKVGFTGGTDNHTGWPGRSFSPSEPNLPSWTQMLTGAWTREIARQPVWDALWARHTWAVVNTRALVWFTVNAAPAGDEITVQPDTPIRARIRLSAEDCLKSVEIISESKTVWAKSFDELDIDIDVDLGTATQPTHFYLRAMQRNGGIIYASPVFVEVEK